MADESEPKRSRRRAGAIAAATIAVLAGLATIGGFVLQAMGTFGGSPPPASSPPAPEAAASDPPTAATATALERAEGLHAGYPAQRFADLYGSPIATRALGPGWREDTFVLDGVAATAVFGPDETARLVSVLVCDPAERPRFVTAPGRTLVLRTEPIASAEQGEDAAAINDRPLTYIEGGTGSSLGQLLEQSVQQPASGNAFTSYLVGINRACSDTAFMTPAEPGPLVYVGSIADAPADLQAYRERTPADFYTQVLGDYTIGDDGSLTLRTADGPIEGVLASPYWGDLPPEFTGLR